MSEDQAADSQMMIQDQTPEDNPRKRKTPEPDDKADVQMMMPGGGAPAPPSPGGTGGDPAAASSGIGGGAPADPAGIESDPDGRDRDTNDEPMIVRTTMPEGGMQVVPSRSVAVKCPLFDMFERYIFCDDEQIDKIKVTVQKHVEDKYGLFVKTTCMQCFCGERQMYYDCLIRDLPPDNLRVTVIFKWTAKGTAVPQTDDGY